MSSIDWTICGVYLLLICLLAAWFSGRQTTNEDYLVGGRRMNWLPVGISLFATTFSAGSFVGLPREAAYVDYHLYLAILFIPLFVAPVVGWLFVPMYHRLQVISAYQYLEWRFNRKFRLLGSALYAVHALGWMGAMLYAVGLILQAVLDLTPTQFAWTIVAIGLFTTVYTAVGGFRVVVWTDVIQSVVLCGVVVTVLWMVVGRIEGGWPTIWQVGWQHDKFQMFKFQFDPTDRANFWTACAYGMFVYLAAHGTGQSSVQRYVSMPTVAAARWALLANGLLVAGVCLLFFLLGTALFVFYYLAPSPTPDAGGFFPSLPSQDQLATYFIQTELAQPGLMGLLLAGLFTAAMSSIDSGINNLTALVVCDWLDGRQLGVRESRWLCGLFGVVTVVMALLMPYLGQNVFDIIIQIAGASFGPLLGLFLLGMFVPRAGPLAAGLGMLASVLALAAVYPTQTSHWWYGAITCVPILVVGQIVSWVAPELVNRSFDA